MVVRQSWNCVYLLLFFTIHKTILGTQDIESVAGQRGQCFFGNLVIEFSVKFWPRPRVKTGGIFNINRIILWRWFMPVSYRRY